MAILIIVRKHSGDSALTHIANIGCSVPGQTRFAALSRYVLHHWPTYVSHVPCSLPLSSFSEACHPVYVNSLLAALNMRPVPQRADASVTPMVAFKYSERSDITANVSPEVSAFPADNAR
jgi:hypothetical protein